MPQTARRLAVPSKELLQQLALGVAFGLAGFLLNHFKLDFYFNVEFIFGSIFSMFALMRFGLVAGITAALVAASYTWQLWHHPWALIIFCTEALCTARMSVCRDRDPVLNNLVYWFTGGIALVLFFLRRSNAFPLASGHGYGPQAGD